MSASRRRASKISDAALLAAVPAAANLHQLLLHLGVAAYGGNYEVIRARLEELGVNESRFTPGRRPVSISAEALAQAVAAADGWRDAARLLGLPPTSGAKRVKAMAERARLETAHFRGQGWNCGPGRLGGTPPAPLDVVLVQGRRTSTTNLRARLIREGLLIARCAECDRDTWRGQPIPLELDHVNGDRTDNRLENLRLLCPNCHAQTPTYRGRNIGIGVGGVGGSRTRAAVCPPVDADLALRRLLLVLGQPAP